MKYEVLKPQELIELRQKLKVSTSTADRLFSLNNGVYEQCENGLRLLTPSEDNLIRLTNCFDKKGRNILPKWLLIK